MKKITRILTIAFSIGLIPQTMFAQQTAPELAPEQIKEFVRAIAVIKHYYIKPTTDKQLFGNAIRGMVASLDPHSGYLDEAELKDLQTTVSGKFVGIGVELTTEDGALKVISPLQDGPAQRAGLKSDDLIIKIDGKLVQDVTLQEAVNNIKGEAGSKVALTVIRKNEKTPLHFAIVRDTIKLVSVKKKMLENGYGYVRIAFFQGPVKDKLESDIKELVAESHGKLRGFILDLRNNPGGLLDVSAKVADTFLDANRLHKYNNVIVSTRGRIQGSDMQLKATAGDSIPNVPMVVMINGGSASASEIVAGALQDYKRAVIIGTRSFGKGSVQTVLPLTTQTAIKLTTSLYYTPAGRVIQSEGIQPDVVVPQLAVSEKNMKGLLNIDENNYRNHLVNNNTASQSQLAELKNVREKELDLAKEDYQLYEGLMMLKGMHVIGDNG